MRPVFVCPAASASAGKTLRINKARQTQQETHLQLLSNAREAKFVSSEAEQSSWRSDEAAAKLCGPSRSPALAELSSAMPVPRKV